MNRSGYGSLALFCLLVVTHEQAATAICGAPPQISVVPYRMFEAPLNTRVLLEIDESSDVEACADKGNAQCRHGKEPAIEIRSAPVNGRRRTTVAATRQDWRSGVDAFAELRPIGSLSAHTAYEIWRLDGDQTDAPKIVGSFTTGAQPDQTAPDWQGITSATMFRALAPGNIRLSQECGEPRLRLEVAMPTDDMTPPNALRAALWVAPAAASIDYDAIPNVIEPLYPQGGHVAVIIAGNADDDGDDLPIIDGKSPWRIGVRIQDVAGNASSPSEAVVR